MRFLDVVELGAEFPKIAVAIMSFFLELAICLFLGIWIFGSFFVGFSIWLFVVAFSFRMFLVSVPEVTGLITINLLTGKLHSYGTGIHFRYPWEQAKEGNYLNLRLETVEKEDTYPSQDGPMMLVKWSYQYRPDPLSLDKYIAADDSTIKEGLTDVGSSILSVIISQTKADNCKSEQHKIETRLKEEFNKMDPTPAILYGIELVRVSLADVDYEEVVQKVRATEMIAQKLKAIAADIRKEHPEISQKDAFNAAMIINGDISKTVTEVEGQGGEALAALLMAMAQGKGGKK